MGFRFAISQKIEKQERRSIMTIADKRNVTLNSGFWFQKEELNRTTTINAVYEQFSITGRIKAFDFAWRDGEEKRPHYFWDSDVAKWMEGAAYILAKHKDEVLENRVDELIEKIKTHQCHDGYFNIYFTNVEPSKRFTNRDWHELYCAGHLIEAAIACDEIGKPTLLECMKKYITYIRKVFVEEKSASFATPGHEEIELALIRLYRHTSDKQYLDLAAHFINVRGTEDDIERIDQNQSHIPVRDQKEATGHAVRAVYLYTAMAMLAEETGDNELLNACHALFENIVDKKMYITGGIGSLSIGETFTNAYDLPNDVAYAETCASIGMAFFCKAMMENEVDSRYADIIEREFFNGALSGLSLDGTRFFYVNPLEINLNEHFQNQCVKAKFPITQRPEIFGCSCCPPNINRFLSSLAGYIFGTENDTLYVHQYAAATLSENGVSCTVKTNYPTSGNVKIKADGVSFVALRIPAWCEAFKINKAYEMKNGYAIVENNGDEIILDFEIKARAVYANPHVARDSYKVAITRGPVVYCAESVDNSEELHKYSIKNDFKYDETHNTASGLPELDITAHALCDSDPLYSFSAPTKKDVVLHLVPYSFFANRGECDMRVWFNADI